jgi:hypothetical protein
MRPAFLVAAALPLLWLSVRAAEVAVSSGSAPSEVAASTAAAAAAAEAGNPPPKPPERDGTPLSTASGVALDMAKSLAFLENGQAYYKVFSKGTHNAKENMAFVHFAEDYDQELTNVKKELEVLRVWVDKKSDLKPD